MVVGNHVELDFSTFFTDEDGDKLTYMAVTSDAAVATASVDGSVVTTTAADAIDESVGTVVTLTVTATDPGGLSAEQEAMVRVNGMAYDTLVGITVDSVGVVVVPGILPRLNQCLALGTGLPLANQFITIHWSEWQLAAGTGWVTAPRTFRDGTQGMDYTICPVKDWEDRQAGTYRLIGNMTILTDTDTTQYRPPTYEDTVTATFRSPTFNNKPGAAQPRTRPSAACGPACWTPLSPAARHSGPSCFRTALPASPGRGGTSRESRRPSARKRPRNHTSPRIHPITRIAYRQRPSPGNLRKPT